MIELIHGTALDMPIDDQSVHCCVTSPPYWGLRDYGIAGQLGLEETPDEYVGQMVQVFREVWRVLRDDGTCWLNLGDSYNAGRDANAPGLKPKDLVGIPWRVAFALQANGWYLRSDIIWHKPNPVPESVTDRPTKAHEYVFLLSKSGKYYYDHEAIKEPGENSTRNKRTVWTITTQPYRGAHFSTFPEKLIKPMILAGTSEHGCCPECGMQWERIVEKQYPPEELYTKQNLPDDGFVHAGIRKGGVFRGSGQKVQDWINAHPAITVGWSLACSHDHAPTPCAVLDPFVGSGTTMKVARDVGRNGIGIDLSEEYLALAQKRLDDTALPMFDKGVKQ